jgi:hypothetical protein
MGTKLPVFPVEPGISSIFLVQPLFNHEKSQGNQPL